MPQIETYTYLQALGLAANIHIPTQPQICDVGFLYSYVWTFASADVGNIHIGV